jgi:chromosome segregation protein
LGAVATKVFLKTVDVWVKSPRLERKLNKTEKERVRLADELTEAQLHLRDKENARSLLEETKINLNKQLKIEGEEKLKYKTKVVELQTLSESQQQKIVQTEQQVSKVQDKIKKSEAKENEYLKQMDELNLKISNGQSMSENEISQLKSQLGEAKNELNNSVKVTQRLENDLYSQQKKIKTLKKSLEKSKSGIEKYKIKIKQKNKAAARLNKRLQELCNYARYLDEIEIDNKENKKAAKDAEQLKIQTSKELTTLKKELDADKQLIKVMKKEINDLKDSGHQNKKLETDLKTIQKRVKGENQKVAELEKELDRLKTIEAENKKLKDLSENKKSQAESAFQKYQEKEKDVAQLEEKISKMQNSLSETKYKLKLSEQELIISREDRQRLEQDNEKFTNEIKSTAA